MKKAGIVTFHRALNYGAVLQTYALQKTVSKLGAECEVVDYISHRITHDYKPFRISKNDLPKSFAKSCVMWRRRAKRRDAFKSFFDNCIKKAMFPILPKRFHKLTANMICSFREATRCGVLGALVLILFTFLPLQIIIKNIPMRQALPYLLCPRI